MIAEILFLGLIMFCDQDANNVCSGDDISDGSPVRALVLNISANGYNCDGATGKCSVCSGGKIKFHEPWLVFQEEDIKGTETCSSVGATMCPRPYIDLCCLDLTNKKVAVHTGGSNLDVVERPPNLEVPPKINDKEHPFGWVANMAYFEPGLILIEGSDLQPGPRVASWVDISDGTLKSKLMTRGVNPNSPYVRWYPFPFHEAEPPSSLAEAVIWEDQPSIFKLIIGTQEIEFDGSQVRMVIANLPDPPHQPVIRQRGKFNAEHFKAYYNLFVKPGECRQPVRLPYSVYFTGGPDLVGWLRDDSSVEVGSWDRPARGAGAGDNAVCSPSKFP